MNLFKGAIQSFYSGTFYGALARRGKGIGMTYILLLTAGQVLFVFVMLFLADEFAHMREMIAHIPEQAQTLPAVTMADGKLSIDKPVPYKLDFGSAPDNAWLEVDTGYKITNIDALEKIMRDGKIFMFVTADKIVTLKTQGGTQSGQPGGLQITDLKDTQPFVITHDNWRAFAESIKNWGMTMLVTFAFFTLLFTMLVYNMIATVFAAVVIMVLDLFAKAGLEFAEAMRLASAARIPIAIIGALPLLIGYPGLSGAGDWVLWLLYLIFAAWAVKIYSKQTAG